MGCPQFSEYNVTFQVLAAESMKMKAFWDFSQCNIVEINRRFRGALMMKAVRTSETSICFNKPTRRSTPEGCYRQQAKCLQQS
jgi:hypothetical protein